MRQRGRAWATGEILGVRRLTLARKVILRAAESTLKVRRHFNFKTGVTKNSRSRTIPDFEGRKRGSFGYVGRR